MRKNRGASCARSARRNREDSQAKVWLAAHPGAVREEKKARSSAKVGCRIRRWCCQQKRTRALAEGLPPAG